MIKYLAFLWIALSLSASAVVTGVYAIYQPLSLHGTDHDSEEVADGEVLQGVVMSTPVALSGAFPEMLIHAICLPHELEAMGAYEEPEANLIVLCGVAMRAELGDETVRVVLDVRNMEVEEKLELTELEVAVLLIESVMKTFSAWGETQDEEIEIDIFVVGKDELKSLGTSFLIGKSEAE